MKRLITLRFFAINIINQSVNQTIMRKIILIFLTSLLLVGCGVLKPYQVDVQQGNILDQDNVKQLQLGMTKNEVKELLGSPLLNNTFENNHWNYVYTNQINGGKIEQKRLRLEFEADKLVQVK